MSQDMQALVELLTARAEAAERERDEARDCLNVVCLHLELPRSESGPCDDEAVYDRALSSVEKFYLDHAEGAIMLRQRQLDEARSALAAAQVETEKMRALAEPFACDCEGRCEVIESWLNGPHCAHFRARAACAASATISAPGEADDSNE